MCCYFVLNNSIWRRHFSSRAARVAPGLSINAVSKFKASVVVCWTFVWLEAYHPASGNCDPCLSCVLPAFSVCLLPNPGRSQDREFLELDFFLCLIIGVNRFWSLEFKFWIFLSLSFCLCLSVSVTVSVSLSFLLCHL